MKSFGWKQGICVVAAVMVLVAAGFGVKEIIEHNLVSTQTTESDPGGRTQKIDPNYVEEPEDFATLASSPVGYVPSQEVRLNTFLTSIVQQNIESTQTDLDEDAELIRFAFGYRNTNDPDSIREQKYKGVLCRTLTLKQVNETLNDLFGVTVSPNRENYSIPTDGKGAFHCIFRNGCFWNIPPYPTEEFSFPLRFALVKKIDKETCTVYFRLYKLNPYAWGEEEAERHVSLTPMMSIYVVENGDEETKHWILRLGEGKAVFRDLGVDLQLTELKIKMDH